MYKSLSTTIYHKTRPLVWKNKTRTETNKLLRKREIKYRDCQIGEDCQGRMEIHHRDYDKPKLIYSLCHKHHVVIHSAPDKWERWLKKMIPQWQKRELEMLNEALYKGLKLSSETLKRYKYLRQNEIMGLKKG